MNDATLRIQCRSAEEAQQWLAALVADDADALQAAVEDDTLVLHAQARTRMGLLRTLDDALECLRAVEAMQ